MNGSQFGGGGGGYSSMSGADLIGQAEFKRRREENAREEAMMVELLGESSPNYWPGLPGLES